MQFGSRGRSEGTGGATADAVLVAADGRLIIGLGLANLETGGACFCEPNLAWPTGARGCNPTLVLVGAAGTFVGRRREEGAVVFMFLSSL